MGWVASAQIAPSRALEPMTVKATGREEISMMLETARGLATTATWENMDQMERNLARISGDSGGALSAKPAPLSCP